MTINEVRQANVGDKVRLFNQRNRYNVMARSDRYVILSKPAFGTFIYSIFDFVDEWIAPDSFVFGVYDYNNKEECEQALKALENGEAELSRRRGISFDEYICEFEANI